MAEKLISIGDKIELKQIIEKSISYDYELESRVYISQVLNLSDDVIQAAMPIFEGHLIPLQVGTRYNVFFKTNKGMFTAVCVVTGRSKEEKIYMVDIIPITEIVKFQRREYFRLDTCINVKLCTLTDYEVKTFQVKKVLPEKISNESDLENGSIIDISGGGMKIVSKKLYIKNSIVILDFNLKIGKQEKNLKVLGRMISSTTSVNKIELKEQRIEFYKITKDNRENIVKYIFEEQRRLRQKERG